MFLLNIFNRFNLQTKLEIFSYQVWVITKVVIFFLVIRYLTYNLIDRVLLALIQREKTPISSGRLKTLGSLLKSVVFYVLIFISGVMALQVFGLDVKPVLTAAGVVGLAVGFGAQKLVRDIIAGFFIALENQYSVGEYITVGAVTGTVEEFGMRVTHLRDDMGKLVIIANGDITLVINHSRGPIQAMVEISVALDSDIEKVRDVIDAAGQEVADKVEGVISAPKANGMTAVDAAKITIRVSGEVKAGRQDAVQNALREAIRDKFAEKGIKLI